MDAFVRRFIGPLSILCFGAAVVGCGGSHAATTATGKPATTASRSRSPASADAYRVPPLLSSRDVYAADRPGRLAPAVRKFPSRVYVPNSESNTVSVIDPKTFKVDQHVFGRGAARST